MASRPSKYQHVVQGLPKYLGEDPARLDLLNALREEILATSVDEEQDYNLSAQLASNLNQLSIVVKVLLETAKKCPIKGAAGLARAYADARVVLDGISEWRSSAQLLVDAYERMMVDKMEEEGVASLRLASGASVSTYVEPYGKVVDKEAFRLWCIANGYEGQLQLWPGTMNAITKERVLVGTATPDGVEVTVKTQVRLNKA
jgi:hypothetical protein